MVQIRALVSSKEYSEFKNLVILLENSFAEINKNGTGIQQVRLAITPEFLVTASYVSLDPNYTSLELVNVIPLDYLTISVHSNRHRRIRLCYCTGIIRYYELSERINSSSVWHNWCDRIQFLSGEMLAASVSDMSINSSRNATEVKLIKTSKSTCDDDPLKDVAHMLDLSASCSNEDIGVIVNKSVFELVNYCTKKREKGNDADKNVQSVPRFASGVSEKCENRLTLGVFGAGPKKEIPSIKSDGTVVCPSDTVIMSVVRESDSDTSVYFSTRECAQVVEKTQVGEKSEGKTVRLYITPRE